MPGRFTKVNASSKDVHLLRQKAALVEVAKHRELGVDARHLRVDVDQIDALDIRILQELANGEPVATAEHQHVGPRAVDRHGRVHQVLVIAVLVPRGELDVTVDEQPGVAGGDRARHDQVLVRRLFAEDDVVEIEMLLGEAREPGAVDERDAERDDGGETDGEHAVVLLAEQFAERDHADQRDADVHQSDRERGADRAERRQQHEREQHRAEQRADVVQRQDLGDRFLRGLAAGEQGRQHRDLESDERADHQDEAVHHELEQDPCEREGHEQRDAADPAHQSDRDLGPDEVAEVVVSEVARKQRSDAHREHEHADRQRELQDAVAEQVARDRTDDQLIDDAAQRDDQDRDEQQAGLVAVDRPEAGRDVDVVRGSDAVHARVRRPCLASVTCRARSCRNPRAPWPPDSRSPGACRPAHGYSHRRRAGA